MGRGFMGRAGEELFQGGRIFVRPYERQRTRELGTVGQAHLSSFQDLDIDAKKVSKAIARDPPLPFQLHRPSNGRRTIPKTRKKGRNTPPGVSS